MVTFLFSVNTITEAKQGRAEQGGGFYSQVISQGGGSSSQVIWPGATWCSAATVS